MASKCPPFRQLTFGTVPACAERAQQIWRDASGDRVCQQHVTGHKTIAIDAREYIHTYKSHSQTRVPRSSEVHCFRPACCDPTISQGPLTLTRGQVEIRLSRVLWKSIRGGRHVKTWAILFEPVHCIASKFPRASAQRMLLTERPWNFHRLQSLRVVPPRTPSTPYRPENPPPPSRAGSGATR